MSESDRSSVDSNFAVVEETADAACQKLGTRSVSEPVTRRAALDDKNKVAKTLRNRRGVVFVGLSKCNADWVIHIGVSDPGVQVPAKGSHGTPVLAFLQERFSPLGS